MTQGSATSPRRQARQIFGRGEANDHGKPQQSELLRFVPLSFEHDLLPELGKRAKGGPQHFSGQAGRVEVRVRDPKLGTFDLQRTDDLAQVAKGSR
jgi:hypothetical protein